MKTLIEISSAFVSMEIEVELCTAMKLESIQRRSIIHLICFQRCLKQKGGKVGQRHFLYKTH